MAGVAEAPKSKPRREPAADRRADRGLPRLADAGLLVGFLGLTALLGAFPLKDTDFWWHLRAGDLIRQTGTVPTVDTFTFGAEGHRWIDLHWIFQVLLSLGYAAVGVPGLTLAKCAVTSAAVALLVTARKPGWPLWAMIVAWLPALIVLGGRMYIRPETLTLLYLAAYLAILLRVDDRPRLALLLPVVQVAWVNTQGLFILGPAVLGAAIVSAAMRRGAFAADRRSWWRTVLIATAGVGLACGLNPYGLAGALYPLQLAGTMNNEIFSKTIAELKPISDFMAEAGPTHPLLLIHLATIALGVLSFLVPMLWRIWDRATRRGDPTAAAPKKSRKKASRTPEASRPVLPDVFRLILFGVFTALSFKANRNSHQFAAVVGTVTAWNIGEWAAEVAARRAARSKVARPGVGRLIAFGATAGVFVAVASGAFYAWTAEGRTIGLGEEPHWFPHDAIAFAGRADMPRRSVCFHNGHAALYEYAYAPERKTYADARLEVMGPEVYKAYLDLEKKIAANAPGWEADLDAMGRPLILVDNVHATMAGTSATLLASRRYRCVRFDPVASLFVHESYTGAAQAHAIDFAARHFERAGAAPGSDATGETMLAKTCWNLVHSLLTRGGPRDLMRPLVWTGLDHARAVRAIDPSGFDGWKWTAMLEAYREPPTDAEPIPRFRMTFDPVFDLSAVRAAYAFKKALEIRPDDGNALVSLATLDLQRGLFATAVERFDRFLARTPRSSAERSSATMAALQRDRVASLLGGPPESLRWANLSELDALLNTLYRQGRAATAADLLESAYPAEGRPWDVADRIATIRLHLGEPARARAAWAGAANPPGEATRRARIAASLLAEADLDAARDAYREAVRIEPTLFEARYGLAVVASDLGHAAEALEAGRAAAGRAPSGAAKSAAATLAAAIEPYAGPVSQPGPGAP